MLDGTIQIAIGITAAALCLAGLLLSCLSISGTWLVALAAALLAWTNGDRFPGWGTPLAFTLLAGVVEGIEAAAGWLGITRRGGSGWAGFAAIAGGLLGAVAGAAVPLPILGSLFGMLAGSFLFAFWVERRRLENTQAALHIATGAVLARLAVLLLKVTLTLGMIGFLVIGLAMN